MNKNIGFIGLDGTYKLTNIRYPLIVMTTVDLRHHIHPIVFYISNNEDKETYAYFIKATKYSYGMFEKADYNADYVMSDGADYIFNSVSKHFKAIHLLCFYHLKEQVRKSNLKDFSKDLKD